MYSIIIQYVQMCLRACVCVWKDVVSKDISQSMGFELKCSGLVQLSNVLNGLILFRLLVLLWILCISLPVEGLL